MPWKELCVMDQRIELVNDWLKQSGKGAQPPFIFFLFHTREGIKG